MEQTFNFIFRKPRVRPEGQAIPARNREVRVRLDQFPKDLLGIISNFLNTEDWKSFKLVCRKFYRSTRPYADRRDNVRGINIRNKIVGILGDHRFGSKYLGLLYDGVQEVVSNSINLDDFVVYNCAGTTRHNDLIVQRDNDSYPVYIHSNKSILSRMVQHDRHDKLIIIKEPAQRIINHLLEIMYLLNYYNTTIIVQSTSVSLVRSLLSEFEIVIFQKSQAGITAETVRDRPLTPNELELLESGEEFVYAKSFADRFCKLN